MTVGFPPARAGGDPGSRFRGNDGLAGRTVGFPRARAGGDPGSRFRGNDGLAGRTVGFPRARVGGDPGSRFRGNGGLAGRTVGFPPARAGGDHILPRKCYRTRRIRHSRESGNPRIYAACQSRRIRHSCEIKNPRRNRFLPRKCAYIRIDTKAQGRAAAHCALLRPNPGRRFFGGVAAGGGYRTWKAQIWCWTSGSPRGMGWKGAVTWVSCHLLADARVSK